ncbi:uncharacterized protein DUF721 [Paucimonas lemoignei]|uniref:Uncharacterized protein DUF721 n=1 Tax=Paucimonas lemoignei TaxID=29443 RepID=A0A4R3HUL5_PAULE|nr:DciA family protein [Paucimonas lemoignei]TCS36917.1 uncharacterized protein DUF721 [Paucimonas lemoignei]
MASSSSFPYPPKRPGSGSFNRTARGITDILQGHDKLGMLLPAVARMNALTHACSAALPGLLDTCSVMNFEAGQLVLSAPNAALASKLKQQLPKLQKALQTQGWQVNAIRIKVQVSKFQDKSSTSKQISLSNRALAAFAALEENLDSSGRNSGLKAALQTMLNRHRNGG